MLICPQSTNLLVYLQASNTFTIGKNAIPVQLRRSSRARHMRLTVKSEQNQVVLTLPRLVSEKQGRRFAQSKRRWIEKQWKKAQEHQSNRIKRTYEPGEVFYYLGEEVKLILCPDSQSQVRCRHRTCSVGKNDLIICLKSASKNNVKKIIEDFYRQKASEIIHDRLHYFNEHYQFTYHRVTFRNQKTRWGSCSAKGNLNFNWRLAMAPIEVIDYVVVHELCHLEQMNHSKAFWNLVNQMIPEYKKRRKWLRENKLALEL